MIRNILLLLTIGILYQSCGFIFYSYRGWIDTNFTISNPSLDTNIRYNVGKFIYDQSFKSELYDRFASKTFDTLCFYGPDYHWLQFKIIEDQKMTKIHFTYFGYNGWRRNPPQKLLITTIRDSLKLNLERQRQL